MIAAGAITAVYLILAIGVVRADRETHTVGFISLQGMMSTLATLPVALPMEHWGRKINFRSNLEMGAAIFFCASLLFGVIFGGLVLADSIWNWA
jgi:hypothetical protein